MKKGKLIAIIISVLIVAGIAVFLLVKKPWDSKSSKNNEKVTNEPTETAKKSETTVTSTPGLTATPTITAGAKQSDKEIETYVYNKEEPVDILYSCTEEDVSYDEENEIEYINSILVVCFTDRATDSEKQAVLSKYGTMLAGQSDTFNEAYLRVETQDLNSLMDLSDTIEKEEIVDLATPDLIYESETNNYAEPNDPWEEGADNFTWDEENPGDSNYYLEAIEARGAWQYADRLSPVKVGVIDSPILSDHEDLDGVVKGINDNDVIHKKDDIYHINAHGTHVAGIIGAKHNNGKGINGVAINSEIIGAYHDNHGFVFDFTDDLTYIFHMNTGTSMSHSLKRLVKNGAKVINVSMGWNKEIKKERIINKQAGFAARKIYCLLLSKYDFIIIQAAGNDAADAQTNGFWSCINENNIYYEDNTKKEILGRIVIVGATEKQRQGNRYYMTNFSNYGDQISICAPGEDIYSTVYPFHIVDDEGNIHEADSDYDELDGTSMAAPIVSGVCAMVWGADPSLTGSEVKAIVCSKENAKYEVIDNPESRQLSQMYYMVNAKMAVEDALGIEPVKPTPQPTSTPTPEPTSTPTPEPVKKEVDKGLVADLYTEVVSNEVVETSKMNMAFDGSLLGTTYYSFYDINKDGVPELLTLWGGPTEGDTKISIYTVDNDELVQVAEKYGAYSVFEYDTVKDQFVISTGHMMSLNVYWYDMNTNNELVETDSYSTTLDWEDSYEAYEERNGLERLPKYSWSDTFGLDSFHIDEDVIFGE